MEVGTGLFRPKLTEIGRKGKRPTSKIGFKKGRHYYDDLNRKFDFPLVVAENSKRCLFLQRIFEKL